MFYPSPDAPRLVNTMRHNASMLVGNLKSACQDMLHLRKAYVLRQ